MTSFNEDDFNMIFAQHKIVLYRYCLKHLENIYDAEEVMNGVYIELFKKWDRLYKKNIKAWLYRTADNLIKQKKFEIHKNRNISFTEVGENKVSTELIDTSIFKNYDFSEIDIKMYIKKIKKLLTPLKCYIFNEKFVENLKTIEIVNQIGLPYSTVTNKIILIRKTAKELLKEISDNQLY